MIPAREPSDPSRLDLAVVGAGPCGLAVGVAARERGFRAALYHRGYIVQSIVGYPTYMTHGPVPMETRVPGVFVAGVIAASHDANKVFIENGRDHGAAIVRALSETRSGKERG